MKKFLQELIQRKKDELTALQKRSNESTDINEVRSIGVQIDSIKSEITQAEAQLSEIEAEEKRTSAPTGGFNPLATYGMRGTSLEGNSQPNEENDPRATMEYRSAFMKYVQTGEMNEILQSRASAQTTSQELGIMIPTTVVQKIMKEVEKVYGQLYSRVRKTNVAGGVKYPIGSFDATFKRITETTVSETQKVTGVNAFVEFSYNIGEIRLARTLLSTVLSVEAFEDEFAKVVIKAYVRAMDLEIMNGDPAKQEMAGILTEAKKSSGSRILPANIIEFTDEDMADWTAWQKKLFAKIPLSMRGLNPEFVMTANTYEANIKTLKDANNRPLYTETFNPVDGTEIARFKGKNVVFVEDNILKNFDDAVDGEYFGMYWIPEEAYAINTNLEFFTKRYFDDNSNQWITKALVINDGKVLDPKYLYLLKKKVVEEEPVTKARAK